MNTKPLGKPTLTGRFLKSADLATAQSMTETWHVHPVYWDYAISDAGRVKRLTAGGPAAKPGRILKTPPDICGYAQVNLCVPKTRHFRVHTLVLETFVSPKPLGCETRHINGNRLDNRLSNLAWGTSKVNSEDAIRHGTQARGEWQGTSKLTEADVLAIRSRYVPGLVMQKTLADEYGVSHSRISYIVNRINWKHVR